MTEHAGPTRHGALLGETLALLATLGRQDAPMPIPEPCLTCAFREGTMPNQTAATGLIALNCVLGIDKDRFACHHGMKAGEPSKLCVGYIAAMLAPWSLTKEVIAHFHKELGEIENDSGADEIQAAFETWLAQVDPDQKMDAYQLARAYAKRAAPTEQLGNS